MRVEQRRQPSDTVSVSPTTVTSGSTYEQRAQALAEEQVVVGDDDADRRGIVLRPSAA